MADVFISYSRKDKEFVRKLHDALVKRKRDTWVDWDKIPPSAKWMGEIEAAIEASQAFIFVISPDFVVSEVCNQEIIHATTNHKKLVPIVCRDVEPKSVPKALAELNWVFFRESDDFRLAIETLIQALDTDLDWVYAHTRLLVLAKKWDSKERSNNFVLRGSDLRDAERWLSLTGSRKEARPTPLQEEYILASRHAATRRKQITLGAVAFACIVAIVLGVLYKDRREVALSRQLAAEALDYLDDQLDRSLLLSVAAYRTRNTVEARSSLLTALKYSPNLRMFLHSESDHTMGLAFSKTGLLASSHRNGSVLLWNITTGQSKPTRTLRNDTDEAEMWSVAFSPDGQTLASGDSNGKVFLWDVATGEQRKPPLTDLELPVTSLAFSTDGYTLAAASTNPSGPIVLWNVRNNTRLHLAHGNTVRALAFSPDGRFLASGSQDQTVILWDVKNRYQKRASLTGHSNWVWAVAFSPDGRTLASGDTGGTILVWNVAEHRLIDPPLTGHKKRVNSVVFRPGDRMLASGDADGKIFLWNVAEHKRIDLPLTGHKKEVISVAFSPDGRFLASGHAEGNILLWDLAGHRALTGHDNEVTSVAFSPNGRFLASGSRDRTIVLWDLMSFKPLRFPREHTKDISRVAFTDKDGATSVSGDENGAIVLWDTANPQMSRTLRGRNEISAPSPDTAPSANGVLASIPERNIVFSGSNEGPITMWNIETGEHCELNEDHANGTTNISEVMSIAVSQDGQQLASGRADGTIFLWDVRAGKSGSFRFKHSPKREHFKLRSLAFNPDGRTLASGSDDGTIILWDVERHEEKEDVRDPSNAIWTLAFSPDGQFLASGNAEGQIILWATPELRRIGLPFTGHKGGVSSVAFKPSSQTTLLASGGEDFIIRLWDLPSIAEWEGQACSMANRNLTEAEGTSLDEETRHTLCSPTSLDESPIRNTETKPLSDPVPPASSVFEWSNYRKLCKMEASS